VISGLPTALTDRIAANLREVLSTRQAGHCVRVDDLSADDARAVAAAIAGRSPGFDVHVLTATTPISPAEIGADRAVELRNRKLRPLLLLVPSGTGHAASSLDNSFEPLPLMDLLKEISSGVEKELSGSPAGPVVREVRHVLGRTRKVETWARFLSAVAAAETLAAAGRELWQVGLVPDLDEDGLLGRLRRNAKAVAAISRPQRPTARVIDRLLAADIKADPVRQRLQSFLEGQEAGALADALRWTHDIAERYPGELTFERWPLTESQDAGLTEVKVAPFRKEDGALDTRCKLRLDAEDGQLYCDVSPDQPGTVVVNWTTEPAKPLAVASWRVEVVPPEDLRAADTLPVAATKVKGDKRRATVHVDVSEDDLAISTLFVVRVQAVDAHGNELDFEDRQPAAAESDQFEVNLTDQPHTQRNSRAAGAASLPEAVLRTAIESGGDLTQRLPAWDPDGQVFDVRIGNRRALVRVSRLIAHLQRTMATKPEVAAFSAHSPLGEPIAPEDVQPRELPLPAGLASRRAKLLQAFTARPVRDLVEVMDWDEDLLSQARGYVQGYRRALDGATPEARAALLAMDTLTVTVGVAGDKVVRGLVLLPTHPLRIAWTAAHDQLTRGWAAEAARAGKTIAARASLVDFDLVRRLSPANLPFITVDSTGKPFVYAEELTYGSALYLPPSVSEPQSAADVICRVIDVQHEGVDLTVSADALGGRLRSYRDAHPGAGAMRVMAVNPGSGALLRKALTPLVLPKTPDDETPDDAPQRLEVVAYSDRLSYTEPVADLQALQRSVGSAELRRAATHLTPPLGLTARDLARLTQDHEGYHVAVVQDLARADVTDPLVTSPLRSTAFRDLLTTLSCEAADDGSGAWSVLPALKPRSSGRIETDIVDAHHTHQAGVATQLGLRGSLPALTIRLDAADQGRLDAVHERADWVVTLDRGIGPEFYDEAACQQPGHARYLLDYAPDFLEGLGKKLTVTTVHDGEVRRILGEAMRSLGIARDRESVSRVLGHLMLVSGRLALRLLRDTSQAVEAVSLAALMAHLERRDAFDGRIVVPVDAHPEIFGVRAQSGAEPARRCDLLLVKVTQRSLRIECVEVKGRSAARLPAALADDIVEQLDQTERVLQRQFFATDPPRIDAALQRARFAGLLHYYAERSARNGLIPTDRLPELHRNIDRVEELAELPEITKVGYVISPEGTGGFPARHREVPIKVLTATDLGQAGFTTVGVAPEAAVAESVVPEDVAPETVIAEPAAPERPMTAVTARPSLPRQARGDADAPSGSAGGERPHVDEQQPTQESQEQHAAVVAVELGKDGAGTPVVWRVSTKGSPHSFILGIPGQGKSVTTRRIIREFSGQGLPSLIIDFHGDMAAAPPPGAQVIDAAHGLPFSPFELPSADPRTVNQTAWEVTEIVAYVCGLGEIQRGHVFDGLRQAYTNARGVPSMAQFAASVEDTEREARGKNARDRIRPLVDFGLFADAPGDTFLSSWSDGAVVDLSGLTLETVQLAAGAFILRKIYREMFRWGQADRLRLAVVLDEAHRLAKDVTLPKLMKEGRKYGVSVVAASQGISDFHKDVLGNAGAKIIFRTNYPESRTTAGFLRGSDGQDLSQQLEQLGVGTAYVSVPDHVRARKVYMSPD
jgi:DNA phosphorothioation-dependent restriction protein DptH